MRFVFLSIFILLTNIISAQNYDSTKSNIKEQKFIVIEKVAEYKGGLKKLKQDLNNSVTLSKYTNGSTYINYTIYTNGRAFDFESLKGLSEEPNNKIILALKELQNWTPAITRGQKIKHKQTIKITVKKGKIQNINK